MRTFLPKSLGLAMLLAPFLSLPVQAASDNSPEAHRYSDCMNAAAEAWAPQHYHSANRQDIAWMLFRAEQNKCDKERREYLETFPSDTWDAIDAKSHEFFIQEVSKALGIE